LNHEHSSNTKGVAHNSRLVMTHSLNKEVHDILAILLGRHGYCIWLCVSEGLLKNGKGECKYIIITFGNALLNVLYDLR